MTKKFVKVLTIATVMTSHMTAMWATDALVVTAKDGAKTIFMLEEKPQVSFNDADVVISTESTIVSFPASDFRTFSIDDPATSINDAEAAVPAFCFDKGLQCSGLAKGSLVNVYSADGKMVTSGKADENGRIHLRFDTAKGTVYIIKTSTRTFKFTK